MLSFAIGALGNRIWGAKEGSHWLGLLVMTFAKIVQEPSLWIWTPLIAGLIFLFRVWPIGWLTDTISTKIQGPLWKAILRGLLIAPLPIGLYLVGHNVWHLYTLILTPLVGIMYWLSGKQHKVDGVELAEMLTGGLIGIL